jgi:hypothetical protein
MTPAEELAALKKYKKERNAYTYKQRVTMVESIASKDVTSLPQKSQVGSFLGDHNDMILMMAAVKSSHLEVNHLFQLKETQQICIGEEENLWQIKL